LPDCSGGLKTGHEK